jgi:hypothetical protein
VTSWSPRRPANDGQDPEGALRVVLPLAALLNCQLADYDDALDRVLGKHPDARTFRSFPGVGLLTAASLLTEIGEDRDHYPAVVLLLAEAGLAPVTRSSGRSHHVGFRYPANTRLREACMWWASNSLKTSPWARAAYHDAAPISSPTTAHCAADGARRISPGVLIESPHPGAVSG